MTREEFIMKIDFTEDRKVEIPEMEFYLRVKGISFHEKILRYLGVDLLNADSTIEWVKVSSLLRYDKRLRNKIYIYLATLEEYLRAFINNKYEDNPNQSFWQDGKNKRAKVKTRILNGEKISEVLQSIELGDLINQIIHMEIHDINQMFEYSDHIKENLDAVRELRNAVSHHVFLMDYKFKNCFVEGTLKDTLEHNIRNLRQLLPQEYRYGKNGKGGITGEIENCKFDYLFEDDGIRTQKIIQIDLLKIVSIR